MNKPVVMITGALTGIGKATAFEFAKIGAKIVLTGRNQAKGLALAKEIKELGCEVLFFKVDVTCEEEIKNSFQSAVNEFGTVDVAVNNAGVEGVFAPIHNQTQKNYEQVFSVNVLGVLLCMKYQIPIMSAQKSGAIINVSSSLGSKGTRFASVYSASKHALEGLTKCAAIETAHLGIRINAVAPGAVETAMIYRLAGGSSEKLSSLVKKIPVGRLCAPSEVAKAIMFLSGESSKYINGQILNIDGLWSPN